MPSSARVKSERDALTRWEVGTGRSPRSGGLSLHVVRGPNAGHRERDGMCASSPIERCARDIGEADDSSSSFRPSGRARTADRARAAHPSTSFPSSPGARVWRSLRWTRLRTRLGRGPRPASEPGCVDPASCLPLMGQVGGPYATTGSHRSRIEFARSKVVVVETSIASTARAPFPGPRPRPMCPHPPWGGLRAVRYLSSCPSPRPRPCLRR